MVFPTLLLALLSFNLVFLDRIFHDDFGSNVIVSLPFIRFDFILAGLFFSPPKIFRVLVQPLFPPPLNLSAYNNMRWLCPIFIFALPYSLTFFSPKSAAFNERVSKNSLWLTRFSSRSLKVCSTFADNLSAGRTFCDFFLFSGFNACAFVLCVCVLCVCCCFDHYSFLDATK